MTYEPFEQSLDSMSSGRYRIWKEAIMVQGENPLFGVGNLKTEREERMELVHEMNADSIRETGKGIPEGYLSVCGMGIHNGYMGLISATGILGFILFISILIRTILRSGSLSKDKWYLLLVFIFTINCFESLFIIGRFYGVFLMFLVLETDMNNMDKKSKK